MKNRILSFICIILAFSLFGCKRTTDDKDAVILYEQAGADKQEQTEMSTDDVQSDSETEVIDKVQESAPTEQNEVFENNQTTETPDDTASSDIDASENKQPQTEQNNGVQTNENKEVTVDCSYGLEPECTMEEISYQTSDTFVGKILSSERITDLKEISGVEVTDNNFYLHKVEVVKSYRCTFVKEGTTVYVVRYANPDTKVWSNNYNLGQQYMMTVFPKIYDQKINILVDLNFLGAQIMPDGKLIPMSYYSEKRFGDISTVDEFEKDSEVQKELSLPCFYYLHKVVVPVIPDGENQTNSTEPTTKIVKLDRKNFETIATEEEIQQVIEAVQNTTVVNDKNEKMYYNFNSSVK